MKSKTSLFNPTIFGNFLRRYWLMWVFYGGLMLLAFGLPLLNALQEYTRYAGSTSVFSTPAYAGGAALLGAVEVYTVILSLLSCGVIAAISFSYLYNARHTGLMNSLPVRRETMFLSVLAADLAGLFIADLVVFLVCLALEAAYGAVNGYALGMALLVPALEHLAFLGFAVCCCMLTGNVFAGPAVYLILNFTAPAVEYMSRYLLCTLQFGNSSPAVDYTDWLSPPFKLMDALHRSDIPIESGMLYRLEGLGVLGAYALAGVVFAVLALALYRKRRMETAGDVVAIEVLKPVFKVCASLAGALGLACVVQDTLNSASLYGMSGLVWLSALMVIGGIIGWFIAQMLVEKTIRVFNHGWKGVAVMSLIFILFLCGGEFDWYGYERSVPEPETVEHVYFSGGNTPSVTLKDPESLELVTALHRSIVEHKDLHEQVEQRYGERTWVRFSYRLNNGKLLSREYWIDAGEDAYLDRGSDLWLLEQVVNTEEATRKRYVMDRPVTAANIYDCSISYMDAETMEWTDYYELSPADAATLYNDCILPDIEDGTLGYLNVVENDDYANSKYRCNLRMEFRWPIEDTNAKRAEPMYTMTDEGANYECQSSTIYLTKSAQRTVAFLNEHGIFPATVMEAARHEGADYTAAGLVPAEEPAEDVSAETTRIR